MGFLENLLRGMAGGHHGKHSGSGHSDGYGREHHDWGNNYRGPTVPTQDIEETKACPKCAATSKVQARFCAQCGTAFPVNRCSTCNADVVPGMKFCPACGKNIG